MLANKALSAAPSAVPVFVEDIFSSYLYTGNGSTQTITNNIDLSTKGGLVWIKNRDDTGGSAHALQDTVRGVNSVLYTNSTGAAGAPTTMVTAFNSNGFSLGSNSTTNQSTYPSFTSWTFAEQAKFFDVVTYTGNGSAPRNISHNLGSSPGFIVIKRTDSTGDWWAWHRSTPNANANLYLNYTDAADSGANPMISAVSSTNFTLATNQNATMNINGATYVAYLFAHDAGGFGLAGSDNVISCGSFTSSGVGGTTVTLNYEPQWLLVKNTAASENWILVDNMRGMSLGSSVPFLKPNLSDAEGSLGTGASYPTATGFVIKDGVLSNSNTYIYIAIRRGPMKTPTSGTSVFAPVIWSGNGTTGRNIATGFPVDLTIEQLRTWTIVNANVWWDRLRGYSSTAAGTSYYLRSTNADAEAGIANYNYVPTMDGFNFGSTASTSNAYNGTNVTAVAWNFKRAPGFFDVVCWTGTGSSADISHNLGVVPELVITKARNQSQGWYVMANIGASTFSDLRLDQTSAATSRGYSDNAGFDAKPTASILNLDGSSRTNASSDTYVAYLFASVTGVSKVFSYTGNGSSQTINCGFTAGARFILLKRTDSTGDWYVYDSARGIVSGNDPQLKLNTTDAEATGYDAIDPDNSGFIVNNDATNFPINVNNATYIGLAIA